MKTTIKILTISLIACVACKKNATTGPEGPQGVPGQNSSIPKGNITGFLTFYDQYGNKQKADTSLVVSIFGSTIKAKPDTTGKYTLKNVSTGEYNLFYTSNNYATGGLIGQSFSGNGTLYSPMVNISQSPTFTITFAGAIPSGVNVNLGYNVNASYTAQRKIAIYANDNPTIDNTPQHFRFSTNGFINAGVTTYTLPLTQALFSSNGFTSGQVVYLRLYPISVNGFTSSNYADTLTGKQVYNAVNIAGSTVTSFTMP